MSQASNECFISVERDTGRAPEEQKSGSWDSSAPGPLTFD